ncbi:MAG: DUF3656 domain-containing protein [Oscillospiraceae bacterium]
MPEILAPAGGEEQLIAAVRCGADAVYLGTGGFNARRNAENFAGGSLSAAVAYCRVRDVAVHVTVNTLVMDSEFSLLDDTVDEIAAAGADAAIIQDLAVLRRFRDRCPDIKRHASTQMTIHNLDGAKLMADMGFDRVVLSRELSLKEIEYITARCGIETEVFVHGALCMCMSGACYLSSMLGGRSGNRGLCAQPCRLDFRSGGREYVLSLKDMSHLKYVKELSDIGVASFKIEGRMKRPEYVAAAVTACRRALEGQPYDIDSLRAVFSRSGFTDGYLTGKRDVNMFGTRRKEDVTAADRVLGELAGLYRAERQSVPVCMKLTVKDGGSALSAVCGADSVTVCGDVPQKAQKRPLDIGYARKSLEKTGGTPYLLKDLTADIGEGLMLPASSLNAMRRNALEELTRLRETPKIAKLLPRTEREIKPYRAEKRSLRGRFSSLQQLCGLDVLEYVSLPVSEIAKEPQIIERLEGKLIGEVPALLFDGDREKLSEQLQRLYELGLRDVSCPNAYSLRLCREKGFRLHGDFGLNIMNTDALEEYAALGLDDATVSFELSMNRIASLGGDIPRGLIAYGRLPLMRFRSCPAKGGKGCSGCDGQPVITDRKNAEFPLVCEDRRFGTLLNSVPLHIADKDVAHVDFLTLYFTVESKSDAKSVIYDFISGKTADFSRTGGLYFRGVK